MISDYMTNDHQRCDQLFATAEELVSDNDWTIATTAFEDMRSATEAHFRMEEEVFFPEFEAATGMTMGPTQVMRQEHAQMRALFDAMAKAVADRDTDAYLGAAETLLILMQQHNAKEEQILYPMLDSHLQSQAEDLMVQARAVQGDG